MKGSLYYLNGEQGMFAKKLVIKPKNYIIDPTDYKTILVKFFRNVIQQNRFCCKRDRLHALWIIFFML